MPADIAIDKKGRAMAAYAKVPAWHGLGTVLDHFMRAKEIIKVAHLDWGTTKVPAYAKVGNRFVEAPDHVALIREDTKQVFGFATPEFQPFSNIVPLTLLESVTGTHKAGYTSAFAIGNGAKCGATLDLTQLTDFRIPGDPSKHKAFLVATWAHDGTEALRIAEWNQRIECANMRAAFLDGTERAGMVVRIAHTGDIRAKFDEAKAILGYAEEAQVDHVALMTALTQVPAPEPNTKKGRDWWEQYLDDLGFKIVDGMARPGHREEARGSIIDLYLSSKTLDRVPHTAYRILQATDEYADHYKPLRCQNPNLVPERAFRSQMDGGAAATLKDTALELLIRSFGIDATPAAVAVLARKS